MSHEADEPVRALDDAAAPDPPAGESGRGGLFLALALLLLLGGAAAWQQRAQHNPDGLCYLRLASYLAQGDVRPSISGYWSPLLVWSLAPLLALGVEPLLAARLALLAWAAVGVVGLHRLTGRLGLAGHPRALVVAAAALILAEVATNQTTPDVVLGACLLHYAAASLDPRLAADGRRAAAAGALGGMAYLAKSYALPFVALHLPLTLLVRARVTGAPALGRPALRAGGLALAGLFAVALPWVGALSWRYERPTWSTVGWIAHAAAGPGVHPGEVVHPLDGLRTPPPPHGSVWEVPEVLPYTRWSPLASPTERAHQVDLVRTNAGKVREIAAGWDLLGLTLPVTALAALVAAVAGGRLDPPARLACAWVPLTFAVYAGGYLPVYVEDRYLRVLLAPLSLALAAVLALEALRRLGPDPRVRRLGLAVVTLLCASFAVAPVSALAGRAARPAGADVRGREAWLRGLRDAGCRGPLAVVGLPWVEGQLWAFSLGETFVGNADHDVAPTDLDAHGAATVIALRPRAGALDLGPAWARVAAAMRPDGEWLDAYARAVGR